MYWWVFKRRLHISWLITLACIGVFIGVVLARYFGDYCMSYVWLLLSIALIIVGFGGRYLYLLPIIIIGSVLFGLWRGSIMINNLEAYELLYGKNVTLQGSVKDDVDGTPEKLVIRLDNLVIEDKKIPGTLWVATSSSADIKRGDILTIRGQIIKGFGSFAGVVRKADVIKIVQLRPGDMARVLRDWFANLVRVAIPEPESSLGIGYLVGQRRSLPVDLALALQMAGLTHVVVASGYNLTILVRMSRRLLTKISKYLSVMVAGFMIIAFILITGLSPSMMRAGLVAALSLTAWYYGRSFHPITLLSVAVALTIIIDPSYAWGDLGWQLSFMAFGGVMILAPLASRYLFGDKKPGFIGQVLIETVSAQILTAPILIAAFGQISNVAIITNLLVLPLVPLAMLLTFIAGLGSLALPSLAVVIAAPATWLLGYMVNVAQLFAGLPWAIATVRLEWWGVVICYVFIVTICLYLWRVTGYNLRNSNLVE
ncbi:MAG: ComEC/Rec2 family competence protein [Candidatus Saccharimonadales bacterium]